MLDDDNSTTQTPGTTGTAGTTANPGGSDEGAAPAGVTTRSTRRRAAGRPAGPPAPVSTDIFAAPEQPKKPARKKPAKPAAEADSDGTGAAAPEAAEQPAGPTASTSAVTTSDAPKKPARSRTRKSAEPAPQATDDGDTSSPKRKPAEAAAPKDDAPQAGSQKRKSSTSGSAKAKKASLTASSEGESAEAGEANEAPATTAAPTKKASAPKAVPMFQAPETTVLPPRAKNGSSDDASNDRSDSDDSPRDAADSNDRDSDESENGSGSKRRRRSRGGRRRNKSDESAQDDQQNGSDDGSGADEAGDDDTDGEGGGSTRRRRRRARAGEKAKASPDDPEDTVVKVREGRSPEDEITGVTGSTRLEAKKQRRREGREAGRRRAPIVSEAEFLARRESVERQMVVRQNPGDDAYTQIAVLEDSVLVEHYVARESQVSIIGNVYLGKVQNVLPSMEAAFVDIGAGRNAVIYAGEVDWSGVQNGKARKIEEALTPGQTILVQATKDPIGQKGARLTSQISLPGRFLVYVPGGQTNGISRKLPDTERARLKSLLKEVLPEEAGVIVRTAAEGANEDQLTRDVTALQARWEDIEKKVTQAGSGKGGAPQLLYAEPDLVIKVVRDLFNEDFASLIVEGSDAWDNISGYIRHVAPDLAERLSEWRPSEHDGRGAFEELRVDEQIHKALERKVWLPSGGSLVIDRTEAMTVVDVNTGKFTGSGGNLEETVTKNNLEAAEEIVRQLRLRDIGGIIVVDFIDMVLESNRDLVLRRLVECLGRDRTRHQVAEVTSLGLVQMTRKRIGTGLLESFSTDCDHCKGRGVVITAEPVEPQHDDGQRRGRRRSGRGGNGNGNGGGNNHGNGGGKGNQSNAKNDGDKSNQGKGGNAQRQNGQDSGDKDSGHKDSGSKDSGHKDGQTSDGSGDTTPAAGAPRQGSGQQEPGQRESDQQPAQGEDAAGAKAPKSSGRGRRRGTSAAAGAPEQPAETAGGADTAAAPSADAGSSETPTQGGTTPAQDSSGDSAEPTDVRTEKADDQLGTSPVLTDVPDAP